MNLCSVARTVIITQDHVDKGIAGDSKRCPAAAAICKTFPELKDIEVMEKEVSARTDRVWHKYPSPEVLEDFVRAVDRDMPLPELPLSFELTLLIKDEDE